MVVGLIFCTSVSWESVKSFIVGVFDLPPILKPFFAGLVVGPSLFLYRVGISSALSRDWDPSGGDKGAGDSGFLALPPILKPLALVFAGGGDGGDFDMV